MNRYPARKRKKSIKKRLRRSLRKTFRKLQRMGIPPTVSLGILLLLILIPIILIVVLISSFFSRKKEPAIEPLPVVEEAETETESESEEPIAPVVTAQQIHLGSTGSIFLHQSNLDSALCSDGSYDFTGCFKYIASKYSSFDYMTCEFEGSIGDASTGYSGYPMFLSPPSILEAIKASGVDMVLLANNHAFDSFSEGFHRTIQASETAGLTVAGTRDNFDQARYDVVDINGIRVGFTDYVYRDRGREGYIINDIQVPEEDKYLINSFAYEVLDEFYAEMESNIAAMKAEGAEFIVADMHWGDEYALSPNSDQTAMAQRLADLGVDVILGGHTHCLEPVDMITSSSGKQVFVIYSQGNTLCNQRKEYMDALPDGHTEDAIIVDLTVERDTTGNVTLKDVDLLPVWCCRIITSAGGYKYFILPLDDVENLEQMTGISGIYYDAQASLQRTMELMGPGLEKVKAALGR